MKNLNEHLTSIQTARRSTEKRPETSSCVMTLSARGSFWVLQRNCRKGHGEIEPILADLQVQSYVRELEFHVRTGNNRGIPDALERLRQQLDSADLSLIHDTASNHIISVLPVVRVIERMRIQGTSEAITAVRKWIDTHLVKDLIGSSAASACVDLRGRLKSHGRQPTYGFIIDKESGEEVLRSQVDDGPRTLGDARVSGGSHFRGRPAQGW